MTSVLHVVLVRYVTKIMTAKMNMMMILVAKPILMPKTIVTIIATTAKWFAAFFIKLKISAP